MCTPEWGISSRKNLLAKVLRTCHPRSSFRTRNTPHSPPNIMKTHSGNPTWTPILIAHLLLVLLLPSLSLAAQKTSDGSIVGTPWRGRAGITETVDQIMAREADKANKKQHQFSKAKHAGDEFAEPIPTQNPDAPAVSQWPSRASAPSTQTIARPLLPQTPGRSFLGVQLSEVGGNVVPPDSMGAIGPTQIIVIINERIKAFTRNGASGPLND